MRIWSALPDGIQTIKNTDGTISIASPNGPIVTLGINDTSISAEKLARNSVTTEKIADGAVTGTKINQMGALTNQVLKWDGTKWSALGTGINGPVFSLATDGSDVYVGGSFTLAGGIAARSAGIQRHCHGARRISR